MLPYGRQSVDESDIEAVAQVLRGDWLTTGPAVAQFEQDLTKVSGAVDAVSVTSGTAALHVAYAALGLGQGDEVVTTPLTFVATASCAAILGARVVFADVSEDTGNLDPEAAAAAVTPRTRAITGVDYAGHPIDAPALLDLAHRHDAVLVEDAAHSIGGSLDGRPVGSLADLTTFSFFPTKNLTTAEGGAVVGTDPELVARARTFRTIGLVRDPERLRYPDEGPWHQEVHEFGLNYRLPDLLCALGSSQLQRLERFKARRDEITARYNAGLADVEGLRLPGRREGADPTWHLYPLRVLEGRRRALFDHLRDAGIGVQVNYIPVYWHPVFEDLGYQRGMCPVAEEYYSQEISLPLFPDLTDGDVDRVVDLVRGFLHA
ncbi:DegT/DnrJ/EryC1/StrS family aminotransferase [Oryzihumus sp.]|uniref:DegT/DnrJ/EryC1/StrS family aminotransferase n=1 Tax=Oryzihumus sp. TaxID=1968903 RepID=UPI002ED85BB7